jgi:hypothetical protein
MQAPLESGVNLTLYDDNIITGQHTYVVDYDLVRDYEYVLFYSSFILLILHLGLAFHSPF